MTYSILDPIGKYQPIAENSTTKQHPLGLKVKAEDPTYFTGEFVYAKGVASCVVGSAVTISPDDWSTALLVADAIGPVGVAMAATVAGEYGWFRVYGKGVIKAATVADNARVWASGSAGIVDDATQDGDMVHGATFASADGTPSAGLAEVELWYPYTDDITTND